MGLIFGKMAISIKNKSTTWIGNDGEKLTNVFAFISCQEFNCFCLFWFFDVSLFKKGIDLCRKHGFDGIKDALVV